jgi:ubiquinone/menaquinone biosynthesis C-methylase UbiE
MTERIKYFNILEARQAYLEGKNITELLRKQKNLSHNTSEIIETAYDLQAGTYVEYVEKNSNTVSLYTSELADILGKHLNSTDILLDIGTGELTTLSSLTMQLPLVPKEILAFDISWSRIYKGLDFAKKKMGDTYQRVVPFVADMSEIPLLDKSVDVTTSSHALEPNGARLAELLAELFRITSRKLFLFEPCYEINTEEGKQRMERLGYIKDIEGTVQKLGGKLVERITIKNTINPINPTACFVIEPPPSSTSKPLAVGCEAFSVPGSNLPLKKMDDFYFSDKAGLCFPILKSIPILKSSAAILASALIK